MRSVRFCVAIVVGAVACAAACSTLEAGTIALVTGPDDPFTEPGCADGGTEFCGPSPTSITISALTLLNADGGLAEAETNLATEAYSGGSTLTLPQVSSDDVDRLQATVYDSAHQAIIFGQTLPLSVGGIDGLTVDLFVQRKGQFAELPSPFPSAPAQPIATLFEDRYVLVGSASSSTADLYDLLLWGLVEAPDGGQTSTSLPCTPLSIAPIEGTTFLLILCKAGASAAPEGSCTSAMDAGAGSKDVVAFQYDVSGASCTLQLLPPEGNQWTDVAGGATVLAPNGDAFIVGGTRTKASGSSATAWVLKVGTAEADDAGVTSVFTSFVKFNTSRLGAAAAFSTHYGLVLVGGNQNAGEDGVEFIQSAAADGGASGATAIPFPTDTSQGEGVAAVDSTHLLVAGGTEADGGVPPVRLFDLGCSTSPCAPLLASGDAGVEGGVEGGAAEAGRDAGHEAGDGGAGLDASREAAVDAATEGGIAAPGPVPLLTAQGFALSGTSALFVGAEADGVTHAFVVTTPGLAGVETPLRVPRKGAVAIQTPIPSVVVVGGDTSLESYIP